MIVECMKYHCSLLLCAVIFQLVLTAEFQLPVDSDDALRMLESRTLDSITWQTIEPYYTIPLNVPSGDFLILKRIFPEILKQLPAKQIISEKYSPWREEQIALFFEDYPQMIEFEPILDFTGSDAYKGTMNFSIANSGVDNTGIVHATFSLIPVQWLILRGRSNVHGDQFRWLDRSITFRPSKSLLLQIGNIDWPDEYGLMSGRFSHSNSNDSWYSNWFYGNALLWNGFCLSYTNDNFSGDYQVHSSLYGHILDDNTQYSLLSGFTFGASQGIDAYLVIDKSNKRQNSIYGGITYQFDTKKITMNLTAGATSQNHHAIPFHVILKYTYATGNCNVSFCHYNDTSGLHKSQKLYSSMLAVSDTRSFTKITSIDILNKFRYSEFPSMGVRLTSTLIDFRPDYYKIRFMLDDEIASFNWKTFVSAKLTDKQEKYTSGGTLKFTGFKPLGMTFDGKVAFSNGNLKLQRLTVQISTMPVKSVMIHPAFLLKQHNYDSPMEMSCELRTVITLWKGTTSQIRIKCPLQKNRFREELKFDCKASFLF